MWLLAALWPVSWPLLHPEPDCRQCGELYQPAGLLLLAVPAGLLQACCT
jgi:hypothetical protein